MAAVGTPVPLLAFLAPSEPLPSWPVVVTPPFFTSAAVSTLPRDGVALVVPFPQKGRANQAMVWQAQAGMWFKMPGGYRMGTSTRVPVSNEAMMARARTRARWPARAWTGGGCRPRRAWSMASTCLSKVRWNWRSASLK